uniref:Cytochrome b n=1 Tax=Myrsidea sp. ADS-2020 TaxID=2794901 RepID=A0A7T1HF13_9NEOP|nr:cytochrome b [Myrsidea sp. ADS-2020]
MYMISRMVLILLYSVMSQVLKLPTPSSISYMWNFGSILGVMLGVQILTGLLLSMHYKADLELAFNSVTHINFNINNGYLIRFFHANGATFFFIAIYLHISRGLYYNSYNKTLMPWLSGITIYFLFMSVAFLGYVLPWGQMSYWGATVITNLISAVPYLGSSLVEWVWGGFSVGNPTLSRFYSLHFILPMVGVILVFMHLFFLHETGSSNPLGLSMDSDKVSFHPFFSIKDIMGFHSLLLGLFYLSCHIPLTFMDPDNFTEANPLVTPIHIQPEWYFLFAYAILRCIPNKLGGVLGLLASILILYLIPLMSKSSFFLTKKHQVSCLMIYNSFMILTFLGMMPVEEPYSGMSVLVAFMYFSSFMLLSV